MLSQNEIQSVVLRMSLFTPGWSCLQGAESGDDSNEEEELDEHTLKIYNNVSLCWAMCDVTSVKPKSI